MAKTNRQYGASNVLVRVYEKDLLTPDYFERILKADNYEEVLQILSETAYYKYLEAMDNTDPEEMLTRFLQDTFEKIYEISPSKELNEYISLRFTYHNIKLAFKENITNQNLEKLYFPLSPLSQSAIEFAVETGTSTRIPELYLESINDVRREYEEYQDLYSIDVILDRRYLQHLLLLAEEIEEASLVEYTKRIIDGQNLITLVRAMKQGRTRNFLNAVLSSSGTIPKPEIIDLARGDFSDIQSFYEKTHLGKVVAPEYESGSEGFSLNRLEVLLDDEVMSYMYEGKRVATGPMPIIAYIHAKEVEVQNLRILLFAKSVDMEIDEIRERMRLNYVT